MSKVRVCAVSDLHGNLSVEIPVCDLLVIPGDICPVNMSHAPSAQNDWLVSTFYPWCRGLLAAGIQRIVFTPGNHDFVFQVDHTPPPEGVTLLIDRRVDVLGLSVYGTPWTPVFNRWAFMAKHVELTHKFLGIPDGLDILVSHGPAYHMGDKILRPTQWMKPDDVVRSLGSKPLAAAIRRAKPKYVFFGHIHTGDHSVQETNGGETKYANVSLLDELYRVAYEPLVVEMEGRE